MSSLKCATQLLIKIHKFMIIEENKSFLVSVGLCIQRSEEVLTSEVWLHCWCEEMISHDTIFFTGDILTLSDDQCTLVHLYSQCSGVQRPVPSVSHRHSTGSHLHRWSKQSFTVTIIQSVPYHHVRERVNTEVQWCCTPHSPVKVYIKLLSSTPEVRLHHINNNTIIIINNIQYSTVTGLLSTPADRDHIKICSNIRNTSLAYSRKENQPLNTMELHLKGINHVSQTWLDWIDEVGKKSVR